MMRKASSGGCLLPAPASKRSKQRPAPATCLEVCHNRLHRLISSPLPRSTTGSSRAKAKSICSRASKTRGRHEERRHVHDDEALLPQTSISMIPRTAEKGTAPRQGWLPRCSRPPGRLQDPPVTRTRYLAEGLWRKIR